MLIGGMFKQGKGLPLRGINGDLRALVRES
jgi:hypothetical protein